jgi:cob(I)alamin adenosyltransferase
MGWRLSKIYTRTGDKGTTGLGDGSRLEKDAPRVEAFGTVDELNSVLGLLLAEPALSPAVQEGLTAIQHELFDLGGELCTPGATLVKVDHITRLEQRLDALNADLPPLEEFILPGGGRAAATAHLARTVCRRAERRVVTLTREETIREEVIAYLNRLSDLLFVIARVLARQASADEVQWHHEPADKPK